MRKHTNIIYIATAEKGPAGGVKIIYDHSERINEFKIKNFSSEVLHLKKNKSSKWKNSLNKVLKIKSNYKYTGWKFEDLSVDTTFKSGWFNNKVKVKKNLSFDKQKDFIIFPEIFAHLAKKIAINNKIPYAIFALNGYALNPTNDYQTLEESYNKAKFIISVSKDITECLKISFPKVKKKILKVSLSVEKNKFNLKIKKKNLITYMPRKMPQHSETIMFFLRKHISRKWKIKKIDKLKEKKVFDLLLQSKIFLSFTQSEGLGMPPIEAAIAGNKVIGYTGEGGKEIWHKPIFTEIPHGNAKKFVQEILKSTKEKLPKKIFNNQRKKIISRFSVENERSNIIKMLNLINKINT
tara:strand:+ start:7487 stop:8542 length:1056 start_codon:yes stop_codon:yes gene_type:complete